MSDYPYCIHGVCRVEVPGSGLVLFRDEVQLLERVPA